MLQFVQTVNLTRSSRERIWTLNTSVDICTYKQPAVNPTEKSKQLYSVAVEK